MATFTNPDVELLLEDGVSTFTRVIGLRPTTAQRKELHTLLTAYRATYNEAVAAGKRDAARLATDPSAVLLGNQDQRDKVMADAVARSAGGWVGRVDMRLRQRAPMEYQANVKANAVKHSEGGGTFCMRFKSVRKNRVQTIPLGSREVSFGAQGVKIFPKSVAGVIPARPAKVDLETLRVLAGATGSGKVSATASLFVKPPHECRLVYDRGRRSFALHVPLPRTRTWHREPAQPQEAECAPEPRVVALDPGVRTFLTGYSPGPDQGEVLEIAPREAATRLCAIAGRLDHVSAAMDAPETKTKRRQRLRRVRFRLFSKLKHLVDDVHWKAAHYLCTAFDVLLLPTFGTQDMVRKQRTDGSWKRKIGKNTSRRMLLWAHYRFRQRLIERAKHHGKTIVLVNEAYTSMTCTCCGALHRTLGASKVFWCPGCDVKLDRDVNGARNILLRNVARAV